MILLSCSIFILELLKVNVTKRFLVNSVLECAHHCHAEETCEAFKHRHGGDDINCQITESEPKYSTTPEVDENEGWTLYTIMNLKLVRSYQDIATTISKGVYSCQLLAKVYRRIV